MWGVLGVSIAPFFLYYPANSNHTPHRLTCLGGVRSWGAARTKMGTPTDARNDYIYQNDVALGRMIEWLEANDDPRNPGKKLIDNTRSFSRATMGRKRTAISRQVLFGATRPPRSKVDTVFPSLQLGGPGELVMDLRIRLGRKMKL